MPTEVIMPKVDMDMASGRIAAWHVAEGDRVEKSAPLFDIETDKAAMEVESPASGFLHHVTAAEGADVPIGAPVAWIYAEGEEVGPVPQTAPAAPKPEPEPQAATPAATPAMLATAGTTDKTRATPAARRLAREYGLSLDALAGSGPRGRVQRADVEARAGAPAPAGVANQPGPLAVLRRGTGTGTPLVLIHGFAADAQNWAMLEEQLPRGAPVYKIELPGHGRSPQRRITGFPDLLAELRAAFDALDLAQAHLVGHSLGGALALALADTRPRRVARLTLIAPGGLGPEIDGAVIAGLCRASRAESLGPWLKQLAGDPEAISWNFVQAAAAMRADDGMRAAQAAMAEVLFPDGVQSFDLSAALDRLDCPARIVWGRRDRIIPWRHALRAPGRVSLNLFDTLGHIPHIEAPAEIARLLAEPAGG